MKVSKHTTSSMAGMNWGPHLILMGAPLPLPGDTINPSSVPGYHQLHHQLQLEVQFMGDPFQRTPGEQATCPDFMLTVTVGLLF